MAFMDLSNRTKSDTVQSISAGIFKPFSIEFNDYGDPNYSSSYIFAKGDASYRHEESGFNVRRNGEFDYQSDERYQNS